MLSTNKVQQLLMMMMMRSDFIRILRTVFRCEFLWEVLWIFKYYFKIHKTCISTALMLLQFR